MVCCELSFSCLCSRTCDAGRPQVGCVFLPTFPLLMVEKSIFVTSLHAGVFSQLLEHGLSRAASRHAGDHGSRDCGYVTVEESRPVGTATLTRSRAEP